MSRLKTLIVSPKAAISQVVTQLKPTQAVKTESDWQKPVWAVSKFIGTIFLGTWAATAGLKWFQNTDLLATAPKMVPGLSWLAMLIGLIVTMKVYWVALLMVPKSVKRKE